MPFETGIAMRGGNLPSQMQPQLTEFFMLLDKHVALAAREKGLFPAQVRLLQPFHYCVVVNDDEVFVVVSNQNVGGLPMHQYIDWSGKEMNLQSAVFLVERDLSFQNAFGISFKRSILDFDAGPKETEARGISEQYVHDETLNLEKLNRLVRINPIFQGRDFLVDDNLFFVFSPFDEPFDTIFNDHIKPTIEGIDPNFRCIRADDIYDNRPIIEDIWKNANQAKIIVAELTGKNPNVFYETGIAHTVGKEVILITQSMDDVPFDLRHLRCIVYDYTPRGVQTLQTNLRNTIKSIIKRT